MGLDQTLLNIVVFPLFKEGIWITQDEKRLNGMKCHRVYPIKEDIPVTLIDEAAIEPDRL